MSKAKLDYTVRTTRAPGEANDTWVPMLVERLQPTDLANVVEKCIDRGLIAGLKPTAAQTIAEGVAEQLAKEFSNGSSIQFGQYFYGRPYLSGRVGSDGRLGEGNAINVRLYKGNGFKLKTGDFVLTFAEGGNNPKVNFLVSLGAQPRGVLVSGKGVKIDGTMLWSAGDTVKVKFAEVGGSASVEVAEFTSLGAELISFDWPTGLEAGKSYSATVERTDANGKTLTTNAKTVAVVAGEPVPVDPPTATGYVCDGSPGDDIGMNGSTVVVEGTNLAGATKVLFRYSEDGEPFYEADVGESTDESAECGPLSYDGTLEHDSGYLSVLTPNGESNKVACRIYS